MGKDGWERLVYYEKKVRVKKSKGDGEGWFGKIGLPLA